jgi:1-deoxy-D-xylulose-5-phosphate synthase
MKKDDRVTVMTAAMCQGNKLETVREAYPDRFFDVGICESHAVAFAAGQAKAGCRPIVDIYSTFLQRSYDQIFQEVCLQNLPVIFMLDRAGLTGPDGPTHHGVFDLGYMRLFPNMAVLAPADEHDLESMVAWAINHNGPVAIRYPKAVLEPDLNNRFGKDRLPIELGHCEPLLDGQDGLIIGCGSLAGTCLRAVDELREEGLHVGLINARFVKPLDEETLLKRIQTSPWVVSVEENALQAGFGSAILEAVHNANIPTGPIRRLGIPDHFIEHGDRSELLSSLSLDVNGIVDICRELSEQAAANAVATPVRD